MNNIPCGYFENIINNNLTEAKCKNSWETILNEGWPEAASKSCQYIAFTFSAFLRF
jgi:hypothetical protein